MHLHRVCVANGWGWWVCLKVKGWLSLGDVAAGSGGVMKVLSHFSTRCVSCVLNVAVVGTRVCRVCLVCCL